MKNGVKTLLTNLKHSKESMRENPSIGKVNSKVNLCQGKKSTGSKPRINIEIEKDISLVIFLYFKTTNLRKIAIVKIIKVKLR